MADQTETTKVFSSSITRTKRSSINNYKDLLQIEPATPVRFNKICIKTCEYEPKNGKLYIPKKKTGSKVNTVRDIRSILEKDVYYDLINDLERQQNYLLQKIRNGCLKDPKLQTVAKKMLSNDSPMTRTVWSILLNINPDSKDFPTQYVVWNGKNIKINGSKGGNSKIIYKFDLANTNHFSTQRNRKASTVKNLNQKKSLLHNSLHVKFKPGPLTKKKFLDISYQQHNFSDLELVRLPIPGLEVQPTYGKPIPPAISAFLYNSSVDNANHLSENWANFAVSVLGTNVNGTPVQSKDDCNKTYDLSYKCFQTKLLMRRDSEKCHDRNLALYKIETNQVVSEDSILFDIKNVINDILGAVEINLEQDKMISGEDELRETANEDQTITNIQPKDNKPKKRHNCELDRLDVTVIRISDNIEEKTKVCTKSFCKFGCICDSLSCKYNIKGHCGRIECMFQCACDYSGYQLSNFLQRNNFTSYLPEIISKEKTFDLKLAKEEKKFHQTVIVTEDKSIVLKSQKRDWKTSKKYAGFYNKMRLKNEKCIDKELYIVANKLNCKNIEPFCLVHNLYRCFCKGKFVNTSIKLVEDIKNVLQEDNLLLSNETKTLNIDNNTVNVNSPVQVNQERATRSLRIKSRQGTQNSSCTEESTSLSVSTKNISIHSDTSNDGTCQSKKRIREGTSSLKTKSRSLSLIEIVDKIIDDETTCSRIIPYSGRKYSNGYYLATNDKIKEMENNDVKLQKKLNKIIGRNENDGLLNKTANLKQKSYNLNEENENLCLKTITVIEDATKIDSASDTESVIAETQPEITKSFHDKFSNKSKLISWLETSYKQHKRKSELGITNLCLGPPQPGRMALYPWDFILSRYRDRKNFFLVTNTKPYRLFMTVNENNEFFTSSINIDNIPWSDIDNYPVTVKNLLTNATDIRDSFFILFGLTHSWELVGSVTKVSENVTSAEEKSSDSQNKKNCEVLRLENIVKSLKQSAPRTLGKRGSTDPRQNASEQENNECISDCSKWFVMTVENDFSEIQFFKKGFFVKYESVMKAINVARASKKTVRLSSQKCHSQQSDPQFGIYAIPSENDSCVFIGPYEKDEKLGIETINTSTDKTKRTRGIWFTTKKGDNLRVIDNPLSFIPKNSNNSSQLPLHAHITNTAKENNITTIEKQKQQRNVIKTTKPIRIGKSNGFYHLASDGLFHQILQTSPEKSSMRRTSNPITVEDDNDKSLESTSFNENTNKQTEFLSGIFNKKVLNKPIAEIAPQVKSTTSQMAVKRKAEGMFVLKPEEINKRSFDEGILGAASYADPNTEVADLFDTTISNDIENFLSSYAVQVPPKDEVYVISDEEQYDSDDSTCNWKYQYIICKNIKSLGWIHGRRDYKNRLSFEFPGFKETDFYLENEAFEKINQVFSRKVYVPKSIILEWCTVDDVSQLGERLKLQPYELTADIIMTKKGLCHKSDIVKKIKISRRSTESTESDIEKLSASSSRDFNITKTTQERREETDVEVEENITEVDPQDSTSDSEDKLHYIEKIEMCLDPNTLMSEDVCVKSLS